jgi:hypothetical protein
MNPIEASGSTSASASAVRAFAIARIAIGAGLIVTPRVVLGRFLGRESASVGAQWLGRGMGGRDIALGLGLLFAVRRGAPVRGWLEAGMLADSTDAVASLLAARDLPGPTGLLMAGAAVGGVVAGRRLVTSLP